VNVDENQNLALRYGIHSIPAVKAFKDGKMTAEFVGVQPEPRLREFIRSLAPSPADLALEKGGSLLGLQQPKAAEQAFRQALEAQPESSLALLGLSKSLLLQGRNPEGLKILEQFPPSHEYNAAKTLLPLAKELARAERGEPFPSENPLDPAFENAMRLARRGNYEAAMDGLLDILREDKRYRDGLARQAMLALLDLLGEVNPITRQYRNELAAVLF
jgi:putative thioredoxin